MENENKFIVAARIGTEYEDCIVVPEDAIIIATHRKVYGPESRVLCEEWKNRNCEELSETTL